MGRAATGVQFSGSPLLVLMEILASNRIKAP